MSTPNTHQAGMSIYQILSNFDDIRRKVLKNVPSANQKKLFGLTLRQSSAVNQVMLLMSDHPKGISLKSLADRMLMHPSAASIMVDKMVNKGFLERTENPEDRRTVRIRISPKGREIITSARNLMEKEMDKLAAHLTEDEITQLYDIATKLRAIADETL